MKHLLTLENITPEWWGAFHSRTLGIMKKPGDYAKACEGKLLGTLFFEPSTRTRFSFQAAMLRLGGTVFGFDDPATSSTAKGESLQDTIRVVASFADIIAIRSPVAGDAELAAKYSSVPVINAGDGAHLHPTQTLADLTTIALRRGGIGNFKIGIVGDLLYGRTVRALVMALAAFPGIEYVLISPPGLDMPLDVLEFMDKNALKYSQTRDLDDAIPGLDIIYMTRIQKERFERPEEYEKYKGSYILTAETLERAKPDALVMHPLPRVDEISEDVDGDPRAAYFEQVRNGMFARMSLIVELLG
ncbi:MAG: aspartate carbamoyltransferase [Oscillospiraceae bacterium]|jgi:aspartate carbamoyltransferase catalytic subunit|nr:aspartate carbamoyltransferase [Oscillospiraceae bacterium]